MFSFGFVILSFVRYRSCALETELLVAARSYRAPKAATRKLLRRRGRYDAAAAIFLQVSA